MEDAEPTPEQLEREFGGWVVWVSVTGDRWYARRLKSSPPVVLRASGGPEIRQEITAWRQAHPGL